VFPSQPEDPYKCIEKMNNYGRVVVPNMKNMFSRSDRNPQDPLPSYMKVILAFIKSKF